ncbi:MAG: cobamide remodeling phosphodiesterase CbiR [Candidatus Hermodarchaeota archaeon]|nr:cobamide remodeling phosphodiesterase CbiR [Candidatus Hermodarchaeota archaeon]
MQFGITALDWSTVMSQLFSKGTLDFSQFDFAEIMRITHNQGFSLMELTLDIGYVLPGALSENQIASLLSVKDELDLTYTAHLPLWSIEPSSPNAFIREASVDCLVDAIRIVRPLDPEVYVMHNAGWLGAEFGEFDVTPQYKPYLFEVLGGLAEQSVKELLQRTGLPSRKIALESIEFPFEYTWRLAERLDTSICLDTGHVLSGQSGSTDLLGFVDRYHSRLSEVHLHDGAVRPVEGKRFPYFDHQVLGKGDMPVAEFLTALDECGFDGPVIFELNREDALESLKVIRKFLPDFPIE